MANPRSRRNRDIWVAFSDGVTEPENESGEFGEERLIELDSGASPPAVLPYG